MKSNLTDEEYALFALKLQRRFNEEIKSNVIGRINLITTQSTDYKKIFNNYQITPIKAEEDEIKKYQKDFLSINDTDSINRIILATPNLNNIPYHFCRHMRNSIAHSWVKKYDTYFEFIDYENERNNIISMICLLDNSWEQLMDDIYNASTSPQYTSNTGTPIQGKIDLSSFSNTDIAAVKGKIQL